MATAKEKVRNRASSVGAPAPVQVGCVMEQMGVQMHRTNAGELLHALTVTRDETGVVVSYQSSVGRESATVRLAEGKMVGAKGDVFSHLTCEYCRGSSLVWCEHIASVVRDRRDAGLYGQGRFLVPIVPNHGVYQTVSLVPPLLSAANVSTLDFEPTVPVFEAKIVMLDRAERKPRDFVIGYLPVEAVSAMAMRSLVIDWITGFLRNQRIYRGVECEYLLHEKVIAGSSTPSLVRDFFSALRGVCPDCDEYARMGKKFSPEEDVPEF